MGPVSWSTSFRHYFLHSTACAVLPEKRFVYLFPLCSQVPSLLQRGKWMQRCFQMLHHHHISKYESKLCQEVCGCPWTSSSYLESRQSKLFGASDWPWVTLQNPCWIEEEAWDLTHRPPGCTFISLTSLKPFQFCFLSTQSRSESSPLNHRYSRYSPTRYLFAHFEAGRGRLGRASTPTSLLEPSLPHHGLRHAEVRLLRNTDISHQWQSWHLNSSRTRTMKG